MLLVQKFGGSSVSTIGHIERVAAKIKQAGDDGHSVVVVVSAMGDSTDDLVSLAKAANPDLPSREMDALLATGEIQTTALLAMVLLRMGVLAKSFTGRDAGILTDHHHRRAHILSVDGSKLQRAIEEGIVPVVAGFQGVDEAGNVTTLGRGGSDLTAIALASALKADRCEIFSDVAGVFTADPRIVSDAVPLDHLSYDEMVELASQGAQVLQTKAVEYARSNQVVIYARSTFHEAQGTRIVAKNLDNPSVTAVAVAKKIVKIGLVGVPDAPGVAAHLFSRLAEKSIDVDLVIQSLSHDRLNDIAFTVSEEDLEKAQDIAQMALVELHGADLIVDANVSKVSAVGSGMLGRPGVAARFFQALADAEVNIQMIGTSEIKISCIVARNDAERAINALHQAFALGRAKPESNPSTAN